MCFANYSFVTLEHAVFTKSNNLFVRQSKQKLIYLIRFHARTQEPGPIKRQVVYWICMDDDKSCQLKIH